MHAQISHHPGPTGRFGRTRRAIRARLRLAADRRAAMVRVRRELEAHSDRDLADLGLVRCDIPRVARATVDRALPTR